MRKIIILFLILQWSLTVLAQSVKPDGTFKAMRNVIDGGYNFWVYQPNSYEEDNHSLPLVVFLHGASLCGNNLNKVRRYGVLDAIDGGLIIPTLVVAPQNPGGSWNPRKLNDLLEWMKAHYKIDESRVYVLGMSLGGYGTIDFAGTYPNKIAAAMALCGGSTLKNFDGLGTVPLWIMHGTADRAVSINESKRVVNALKASQNDKLLRYDWLQGGTHGTPARVFYVRKTYDWLFYHSLKDNPREVWRQIDIDSEDLKNAYREMKDNRILYDAD